MRAFLGHQGRFKNKLILGKLTTKYMSEFPFITMKIPCNQFLSRRLLGVILTGEYRSKYQQWMKSQKLDHAHHDIIKYWWTKLSITKTSVQEEETLFQQPGEEQRILHEYWYHLQSMFCRNSWLAVCWGNPILLVAGTLLFALATENIVTINEGNTKYGIPCVQIRQN